jgi:hypothetical protein
MRVILIGFFCLVLFSTIQGQNENHKVEDIFSSVLIDYKNNRFKTSIKKIDKFILSDSTSSKTVLAFAYFWKANIFEQLEQPDSAKFYAQQSLNIGKPFLKYGDYDFRQELVEIIQPQQDKPNIQKESDNGFFDSIDWCFIYIILLLVTGFLLAWLSIKNKKQKIQIDVLESENYDLKSRDISALYIQSLLNSSILIKGKKIILKNIIYVQKGSKKNRNKACIYLNNQESLVTDKPLSYFEVILPFPLFFKSYQSVLVNVQEVTDFDETKNRLLMSNEESLEVAFGKKNMAKHIFGDSE